MQKLPVSALKRLLDQKKAPVSQESNPDEREREAQDDDQRGPHAARVQSRDRQVGLYYRRSDR
jgi:hypothetical protein